MARATASDILGLLSAIGHPPYEHETSNNRRSAIGYMRVSTEKQETEERGLERQMERLKRSAQARDITLAHIYEDIGSGRGKHSAERRPGFMQALREAKCAGVPIVVTSASRLSRDRGNFEKLAVAKGVEFIVLDEGGYVGRDDLLRSIEKAEAVGHAITGGAARAARAASVAPGWFDTPEKARAAAETSAKVRTGKRIEIVDELADIFQSEPELQNKTTNELVCILNTRGVLSSSSRKWTYESLRKKLTIVRKEISERCAMFAEVEKEPFPELEKVTASVHRKSDLSEDRRLPTSAASENLSRSKKLTNSKVSTKTTITHLNYVHLVGLPVRRQVPFVDRHRLNETGILGDCRKTNWLIVDEVAEAIGANALKLNPERGRSGVFDTECVSSVTCRVSRPAELPMTPPPGRPRIVPQRPP